MKRKTRKNTYLPYPIFTDKDFSSDISNRKEFTNYVIKNNLSKSLSVESIATQKQETMFDTTTYQKFIKAYMAYTTPYNGLLLYHGLGTGKTCAAIGIAENTLKYNQTFGLNMKIFIVASIHVRNNFKLQLFDESKLTQVNGRWMFTGCVGNSLINEINPTHIKDYPKEKIVGYINNLISKSYVFLGYVEFANLINILYHQDPIHHTVIQKELNGSTVIIDEYHNIKNIVDNGWY
jgi:hypothetical protein